MSCKHMNFSVIANVGRITETGDPDEPVKYFHAEFKVNCEDCSEPFQFLNLPVGLDTHGATTSPDGLEGRFGIAPNSETVSLLGRIAAVMHEGEKPS